jgi:hypothetical protein
MSANGMVTVIIITRGPVVLGSCRRMTGVYEPGGLPRLPSDGTAPLVIENNYSNFMRKHLNLFIHAFILHKIISVH